MKKHFRALTKKNGEIRYLPEVYEDAESAARGFDENVLRRKGILMAFPLLNFPSAAQKKLYEQEFSKHKTERAEEIQQKDERLRCGVIEPKFYVKLLQQFHGGQTLGAIAANFGTHVDNVRVILGELGIGAIALGVTKKAEDVSSENGD